MARALRSHRRGPWFKSMREHLKILMNKFILLANARSGSTSLAKLLDESKDVHLCLEPFHPDYSKWNSGAKNYSTFIKNSKTMNQALDEIFSDFNAMKVLVYQFPKEIYLSMLSRKDFKIIFLRRKRLEQAALSSLIADQTAMWHKKDMKDSAYDTLSPIKTSAIQKIVDYIGRMNEVYAHYLQKERKGEYMNLFYENLYSEDMDENVKKLTEICIFLDIPLPSYATIEAYMKPSNSKQNYTRLYKKLPNFKEVEKKFPGIFD